MAHDPTLDIGVDTLFVSDAQAGVRQSSARGQIFAGGLAAITPLLWLLFATNLMANFFLSSWIPILFQDAGMDVSRTAKGKDMAE